MMHPLVHALLYQPVCFDHPVGKVRLVETHISWVLLTGVYAYKIKKPVNLGFLDFSTLEKRHLDCVEELRLNRRLAAEYYLDVVPITGSLDAPRINGAGQVIEYAVKMREFPADATLDLLAGRGELSAMHIDALALRLAHFHLYECEVAPPGSPWGEPEAIARHVMENFRMLVLEDTSERQSLANLQDWSVAEHARLASLMREREVRECHGDLHLANVAWADGKLVIFDCLEFDPGLRWIDVISEVAFCHMDLLHREEMQLAWRFLNAWLSATGDYRGLALLRYYFVYRALVRAKVAGLRAAQQTDEPPMRAARQERSDCLKLAIRFSERRPPALWITHGLSGSGKTTLTQTLLEKNGMIRLRSDVERKRLAGLEASAHGGEKLYASQVSRSTYEHLAKLAEELLTAGWPVIVDAAFLEREQRDLFRNLAKRFDAEFRILDIRVEPEVLRARVRQRQTKGTDASDADLAVLERQLKSALPLEEDELIDTMPQPISPD